MEHSGKGEGMHSATAATYGQGAVDWVLDQVPEALWSVYDGRPNPEPADLRFIVEYTYLIKRPEGDQMDTSLGFEYFTTSDPEPCFTVGGRILLNNVPVTVTDLNIKDEGDEETGKPVRFFSVRIEEFAE